MKSIELFEACLGVAMQEVGFNEHIAALAQLGIDTLGRSNRLLALANGNPDLPDDVEWLFNTMRSEVRDE